MDIGFTGNSQNPVQGAAGMGGQAAFARAALRGLTQKQKSIPCTWLYDQRGSELFEQITALAEYYPTRTEISLLRRHACEIAAAVGPGTVVLEIGSGSSCKTPLLLQEIRTARAYVPIDIATHCLEASVVRLRNQFSDLPMHPLVADFHRPLRLPTELMKADCRHLCFFPGSTIGNFDPGEARAFLRRMAGCLGRASWMLIGVDCTRDPAILIPAYDDSDGITAAFNLNLLARLNRELGSDFDLPAFQHEARYDAGLQRIEMHLVSRREQKVRLLGKEFRFAAGESIHTENSYKYSVADFQALALSAGWRPTHCWSDADGRFSIHFLERPPGSRHSPSRDFRKPPTGEST